MTRARAGAPSDELQPLPPNERTNERAVDGTATTVTEKCHRARRIDRGERRTVRMNGHNDGDDGDDCDVTTVKVNGTHTASNLRQPAVLRIPTAAAQ